MTRVYAAFELSFNSKGAAMVAGNTRTQTTQAFFSLARHRQFLRHPLRHPRPTPFIYLLFRVYILSV